MLRAFLKKIIYRMIHVGLTFFVKLMNPFFKKKLDEYGGQQLQQLIFIIGAPRTGSTVLYQSLTNQSDALYVDNLVCLFFRNFLFGFWLSNKLFKQKTHNCFKSKHGNTNQCGWHAPSECGSFWYRWLPKDRHFVDSDQADLKAIQEIKEEITATSNYFKKPMVFKNLNAGQRLRMLVKAFPDAKFIFVRRDPIYTVQSILKAKRQLKIPDNQFWSIMPPNVEELKKLDWPEQIVKQVYFLEKQIAKDLQLFPRQNVYEINYTELTQKRISVLISELGLTERETYQNAEIKINEKLSLSDKEIRLIENEIEKLDWSLTHVK